MHPSHIHIVNWNANGLSSHIDELLNYIDEESEQISFICIQETWICSNFLPDIPGYNFIHTFRNNKKGGGSAIYIRRDIVYNNLEKFNFVDIDIEISGIEFQNNKSENISLLSVYIAPDQKLTLAHLNKFISRNSNVIIAGDFNAKHNLWGSQTIDARGKVIERFLEDNDLVCINKGEGTRIHYNGTISHLDLVICSKDLAIDLDCKVGDDTWGSDHYPIFISLKSPITNTAEFPGNKFNYKKADWTAFNKILQNDALNSSTSSDVSTSYCSLLHSFIQARNSAIPYINCVYKHRHHQKINSFINKQKLSLKKH